LDEKGFLGGQVQDLSIGLGLLLAAATALLGLLLGRLALMPTQGLWAGPRAH
jgi:hypothetical protein